MIALEKELDKVLEPFRETAGLLQSIPEIEPVTSASYIAVLGRPDRFVDSSHLVNYIGLAVSTYNSGERERHGHITKRGSSERRMLLCEAAHHSANPRHPLNPYFRRISAPLGRSVVDYRLNFVSIPEDLYGTDPGLQFTSSPEVTLSSRFCLPGRNSRAA